MAIEFRGLGTLPLASYSHKQQLFLKAFWPWLQSNTLDCWRAMLPLLPEGKCLAPNTVQKHLLKISEYWASRFEKMMNSLAFAPPHGPVLQIVIDSWRVKLLYLGLDAQPIIPGFIPNIETRTDLDGPPLCTVLFLEILDPVVGKIRLRSCSDGKTVPWEMSPAGIKYFLELQRSMESRISDEEWEASREAHAELCSGLKPMPAGEDWVPPPAKPKSELEYDPDDPSTCSIRNCNICMGQGKIWVESLGSWKSPAKPAH